MDNVLPNITAKSAGSPENTPVKRGRGKNTKATPKTPAKKGRKTKAAKEKEVIITGVTSGDAVPATPTKPKKIKPAKPIPEQKVPKSMRIPPPPKVKAARKPRAPRQKKVTVKPSKRGGPMSAEEREALTPLEYSPALVKELDVHGVDISNKIPEPVLEVQQKGEMMSDEQVIKPLIKELQSLRDDIAGLKPEVKPVNKKAMNELPASGFSNFFDRARHTLRF